METVTTGQPGLDRILDGLRLGDNVVWRVEGIDDYRRFALPFVTAARQQGRDIIYLRFGQHGPLLDAGDGVTVVPVDPGGGFESFTRRVWELVSDYGRGAFYVCDCLSDLLDAWVTDTMIGHFFRVICPRLFELDTVAWFALNPSRHSQQTLDQIRQTTQVLIDIHRHHSGRCYLQPVKVWQRHSPTMFLLHQQQDDDFVPVTDSADVTALQSTLASNREPDSAPAVLDYWDRLFEQAKRALTAQGADDTQGELQAQILNGLMGRDPRIRELAGRYFSLADLVSIGSRMIGTGFIGGKAVGMLLARRILEHTDPDYWQQQLQPHDSWYLGSDVFYAFLVHNGCWPRLMKQRRPEGYFAEAAGLQQAILAGELPHRARQELQSLLDYYGQYPILVRSSSLLEDGFGNAFAGKYDSIFLNNQGDPETRLAALEQAICRIYASSLSEDALTYRRKRGLDGQEEPMALLIQRVNGRYHGRYYLPDAAGVGISRNPFVWRADMDPAAGMVRLVFGLGTRAVDRIEGDHAAVMALDSPERRPYPDSEASQDYYQHLVDVLDIGGEGLRSLPLNELATTLPESTLGWFAEEDRAASRRARDLGLEQRIWRLSFAPLIERTTFAPTLRQMLNTLETGYGHPVEVEFTLHLDSQGQALINPVQCRPMSTLGDGPATEMPQGLASKQRWLDVDGHFMGGNANFTLSHVVRIDPARYGQLNRSERYAVARRVGKIMSWLAAGDSDARILLMGPGRWGTSTPELGVPVRFADIQHASVLVEIEDMGRGLKPDLSYGSHFFHDLVESNILYVALFADDAGQANPQQLPSAMTLPIVDEAEDNDRVRAAIAVHALASAPLRVTADLVAQRLMLYFP